jgi:hypothetical protein
LGAAIHYRDWFELVQEDGVEIVGKDPLATFLTQITRSPVVVRVDEEQGVYALDPHGAYERARDRFRELVSDGSAEEEERDAARRELDAVLEARTRLLSDRFARSAHRS